MAMLFSNTGASAVQVVTALAGRLLARSCLSSGLCRAGGGHVLGCGHCGLAYAVLVTHGPGRPWTCVTSAATCTDAAACPTSTRCYGIDSTNPFIEPGNLVLRSADGGAVWHQVGPDWTRSVLNDIACPATLTCYSAGTHGSVARITKGTTLAAQRTPTTRDLFGISCPSPYACYAVGEAAPSPSADVASPAIAVG